MKKKSITIITMLLSYVMLAGTLTGCQDNSGGSTTTQVSDEAQKESLETSEGSEKKGKELTRASYVKQLEEIEALYQKHPDDHDILLQYAQILYTLGDFDESQEILSPLLNGENSSPKAIYLSAQIEYLNGNYSKAEKQYKTLVEEHYDEYGLAAEAGLQMVYYQTNQYNKAKELFVGQDLENPMLNMMKAFGDTAPYQIDWNGKEQTVIPFVTTTPLAVVPIEINGVKMNAFIDTGGNSIMVDETMVSELGIETISNDSGTVAGGTIDFSFGKTDSMKLGEAEIKNVPVTVLSFEGIADAFEGYASDVHAIIGTNVLQQFISTLDYPSGKLILMPRNKVGAEQLDGMLTNLTVLEEVPFTLADSHFMYVKGSINGYKGLNMFVDSGGADEKGTGLFFIKDTMDYLDIPIPSGMTSSTGVGPDSFEAGWVDISSYGLGNLQMKQGVGYYDTSGHSDDLSDITGFIHDALINHDYLKQYKWTIDFDSMTMTFSK